MIYTNEALDHFMNPRNVGELQKPDGIGTIGDLECGDFLQVHIQVQDGIIAEIRFLCQGCPAAIACASKMTELAHRTTLERARSITDQEVAQALGGLPTSKMHCSNLGAGALHAALDDYTHHIGLSCKDDISEMEQDR